MARPAPPAYAWDWFARQRLLWREVRTRLAAGRGSAATRYAAVDTRSEVVPMLRADYPADPEVARTVDAVVGELAFLSRLEQPFASLGARNAPRGMRWWWTALTGEQLEPPPSRAARTSAAPTPATQLALVDPDDVRQQREDVLGGYGG